MPHRPRSRLGTAGCLLSVLALVACGTDDRVASEPAAPVAVTPTSASPSASPSPSSASSSTPSPTAATSATARPAATATPVPALPPASQDVRHGGEYSAVYLAVSRLDTSGQPEQPDELEQARRRASEAGYAKDVGSSDVGCDQGAREALRLDPDREYLAVSIYFDTQRQAEAFVAGFSAPVVGIARITAFCLD